MQQTACGGREGQYEIEKAAYEEFLALWEHGKIEQQRLGHLQSFPPARSDRSGKSPSAYEAGEREAIRLISSQFLIR